MATDGMQSVARLFQVLEAMTEKEFTGVRELKAKTGINSTTIHRILNTLVDLGYVRQNKETEKYALTYKLTALGNVVSENNSVIAIIHPYLEELSNRFGETVHLVERVKNNIRYIDKITPNQGVFATGSYVGLELPLTSTAVGKSILAYLPNEEIETIWNNEELLIYTEKTIKTFPQLQKEIDLVRQRGFAYDDEEREVGLFCVAICLGEYFGQVKYAISLSAPVAYMKDDYLQEIQAYLLKIKTELLPLLGKI